MAQTEDAEVGTYAWDNSWVEARRRLELLEQVWDAISPVSLLPQRLSALGLTDMRARGTSSLFRGGSPEAEFWRITWIQSQDRVLAGGLDKDIFDAAMAMFDDETQWMPAPANVTVTGRLPG